LWSTHRGFPYHVYHGDGWYSESTLSRSQLIGGRPAAGLLAAGTRSDVAFGSVLTFRLMSFWLVVGRLSIYVMLRRARRYGARVISATISLESRLNPWSANTPRMRRVAPLCRFEALAPHRLGRGDADDVVTSFGVQLRDHLQLPGRQPCLRPWQPGARPMPDRCGRGSRSWGCVGTP
jgi:hypothetical protein